MSRAALAVAEHGSVAARLLRRALEVEDRAVGHAGPDEPEVVEGREHPRDAGGTQSPCLPERVQAAVLVAEARREVTQSAQAIAELCLIAGCPDKAAAFIAEGKSEADVRRLLCEAKAARSEATPIHSTITPEAGTEANVRPEASPVVAAVKKLIHKE